MNRLARGLSTAAVVALGAVGLPAASSAAGSGVVGSAAGHGNDFGRATLTAFASLPAQTYVSASDPSGSLLGTAPINGITPPFADQPVQGFSGVVSHHDGTFDVLSDNGYGTKANSGDFVLRIHRIGPVFDRGGHSGGGTVDVLGGINLTDPDGHVPFPLTRADRVLTGADLDVESMVRAGDGSTWLGDEFGPFLLHVDRAGRVLEPPISLPGVFAPENPLRDPATPVNLPSSKGFEGMASSPDGRFLFPLLEGSVAGDTAGDLRMYEFDIHRRAYTSRHWVYRLDSPANAIGDAIALDANRFLVIERDGGQGDAAMTKRVYLADNRDRDHDGAMDKTLVADLLNIANPRGVGGFGATFRFPFVTIEDIVVLDDRTLGILNDNNFPFSSGRTPGQPDNNEFITLRLGRSLNPDPRVLGQR